ncbi:MAG: hypothetical protein MUF73_20325 [Rhodobacteraceae bacterium]|jgi:hypothetical protein|nr:hypothetical protein [Paracoccaceae bacterium]
MAITAGLVAGCAPAPVPGAAEYLGAEARLITDEVMQAEVRFRGTPEEGQAYALCVAALAAGLRGDVWLRHLRTVAYVEAGIRRLDTLYTLSPEEPAGVAPVRAADAVADCDANGVPVV